MDDVQQVSDSRVLAAMAHPLRRRMLSLLRVDGPMTVSMLAERTDQAVGNVSHHLRMLATSELVEEVPELARDRRERWWRRTANSLRWSTSDFAGDPVGETIAHAVESINADYRANLLAQWANAAAEEKANWPSGPFATDIWLRLTDAELAELGEEMIAVMRRWADRSAPDDGADRPTVYVFAQGLPGRP
jgi:DNA-binding transcriptional ArsR family regulator